MAELPMTHAELPIIFCFFPIHLRGVNIILRCVHHVMSTTALLVSVCSVFLFVPITYATHTRPTSLTQGFMIMSKMRLELRFPLNLSASICGTDRLYSPLRPAFQMLLVILGVHHGSKYGKSVMQLTADKVLENMRREQHRCRRGHNHLHHLHAQLRAQRDHQRNV